MSTGAAPSGYIGRFAPSPTGPLHAGSLVAALASWLDARAHALTHPHSRAQWLVRIEDVDQTRCLAGMGEFILQQLHQCGLHSGATVLVQSTRGAHYEQALQRLAQQGLAYGCNCTRKDIEAALAQAGTPRERHGELHYPSTCRQANHARPRAWRFAVPADAQQHRVRWHDRALGPQEQDVAATVGDFVLRRADGGHAYQLAVVVDDALQGVTHVVRGADLADNTPRQILLQRALGCPTPHYLHTPLVLGADAQKLSKQNGAAALDLTNPLLALNAAAAVLGLGARAGTVPQALAGWAQDWAARHGHR